ncbi:hypothetical protein ACFLW6_04320 [Chloroflexota bacterium]
MCSPTPEMASQALEVYGNPEPDLLYAVQSPTYRRQYRNMWKKDMLPSLKAEAKEPQWHMLRLLLTDMVDELHKRGYRSDYSHVPKVGESLAGYTARTEELTKELNSQPAVLSELFPPGRTLGYERARNVLQFLGGGSNCYTHSISLIFEIRRQPNDMRMSKRHISYLMKRLTEVLPQEVRRVVNELKSLREDEGEAWVSVLVKDGARRKRLVTQAIQAIQAIEALNAAEDKILRILQIIVRYLFLETIPSIPGDEESSHKRLSLDHQIAAQIADGQVSNGAWRSTPQGMKPVYKLPAQEEPSDDSERLDRFATLAGIDMNALTPKEQQRLMELMEAFDMDYNFASKKGVPIAAFYGDRADSEKTQRQRLFKKIRDLQNRDSVRD